MAEFNEIEDKFIHNVLDTHGEFIEELLIGSIEDKGLRDTDSLLDSIESSVEKRGNDYALLVSFLSYGRAMEIAWHKSKRIRRDAVDTKKDFRRAKKKDTRFYAKNVYGSINRLVGRLGSEYTDAMIERLKEILEVKRQYLSSKKQ